MVLSLLVVTVDAFVVVVGPRSLLHAYLEYLDKRYPVFGLYFA